MNRLKKIFNFYVDGFKGMDVGKTLWLIIGIKLFIMFAILKVFFFKYPLSGLTQEEKSDKVRNEITDILPSKSNFEIK